jgi:hypothetical protein
MIRVVVFFLTFILIILYYVFMLGEIILLLT